MSFFKSIFSHSSAPKGELSVWIMGIGLALGLIMIFGFLCIIFSNGLETFWPKTLQEFQVTQQGQNICYYGTIAKEASHKSHDPETLNKKIDEYQIFTGNKEVYGQSFRYINKAHITQKSTPKDLIEIERLSGGTIIAQPLYLESSTHEKIDYCHPSFISTLTQGLTSAQHKHKALTQLDKGQLNNINTQLNKEKLQLKGLEYSYNFSQSPAIKKSQAIVSTKTPEADKKAVEQKIQKLTQEYTTYTHKADDIRKTQGEWQLHYQLGDQVDHAVPLDNIASFQFPNQLSFLDKSLSFFEKLINFIVDNPREANTEGGIFPAIFGTFVMTVLMSMLVTPIGVIAAIYLHEYAKQGTLVKLVRICVNNLAGVPSIVFGVFGLGFFVYFIGGGIDHIFFKEKLILSQSPTFGTSGVLWASLTLALMTLPVVIVATEESLSAVPQGLREAALACGASKWQMIQRIILPQALPGILTGLILAMARGAGEVAPLMLTGVVKLAADLPLDTTAPFIHLERKFMHLGFHIYDVGFQSPDSDAARSMVFATTVLLIVLVIVMNLAAIIIRSKLRKKYQASTF